MMGSDYREELKRLCEDIPEDNNKSYFLQVMSRLTRITDLCNRVVAENDILEDERDGYLQSLKHLEAQYDAVRNERDHMGKLLDGIYDDLMFQSSGLAKQICERIEQQQTTRERTPRAGEVRADHLDVLNSPASAVVPVNVRQELETMKQPLERPGPLIDHGGQIWRGEDYEKHIDAQDERIAYLYSLCEKALADSEFYSSWYQKAIDELKGLPDNTVPDAIKVLRRNLRKAEEELQNWANHASVYHADCGCGARD